MVDYHEITRLELMEEISNLHDDIADHRKKISIMEKKAARAIEQAAELRRLRCPSCGYCERGD